MMRETTTVRSDEVRRLYDQSLPSSRQGALYNAFSYPTKISAESVAVFIGCHSKPGDTVLDVFGGSGTTAIAARLCSRPTERMREIARNLGVEPEWGPRNAVVYELSVIGSLAARVMSNPPDPEIFSEAAQKLVETARTMRPELYATTSPEGAAGEVRHVIWSDVVSCPRCDARTTYADVRVLMSPLRFADTHRCDCGYEGHPDTWKRVLEDVQDPWTGTTARKRLRVPWRVYGKSGKNWSRPAIEGDVAAERVAQQAHIPDGAPVQSIAWGDLHRNGYHQGITYLHDLYTARNFVALATLWKAIELFPEELHDPLRLLVLSYNASHATLMTRVVLKRNSTDFVLTGAQPGVLYVSGLPVEKNVFIGVKRKITTFAQAFALVYGTEGAVRVVNASSTHLDLPNESIDYLFTDPPFGGYIPYSEINQVNEMWLGQTTETTDEAIVSPAQDKGINEYQSLLTNVFKEVNRTLKPSAPATMVFHSAHASVWAALANSLKSADLAVEHSGVLDKTQGSFKQVSKHVTVNGDPLLLIRKAEHQKVPGLAQESLSIVGDRFEYSRAVGSALARGELLGVDAKEFYKARSGAPDER
jgi:16S rRNA G966 N2-methylase RsmD